MAMVFFSRAGSGSAGSGCFFAGGAASALHARQEKEWCRFHGVVRYKSLDPYDMGAMEMQAL